MIKKHVIKGISATGGPHLLIFAGVHGDEFEPMVTARTLIAQLKPADVRGTVTIVPVANEPAFRNKWRTAEDGLDLARTFPGRPDGSVTQRVAHELTSLIQQADFFIDLHTGGSHLAVYPLAGYMLHPDKAVLEQQRAMARAFNLPLVWGTDYRLQGRSLSVGRDANVPSIYSEYGGSAVCTAEGVQACVTGCLNVMAYLGMTARPRQSDAVRYVVEDGRENAGFMQIQNPAPCDGYFLSTVAVGQHIKAGDAIGVVSDELGFENAPVTSQTAGLVVTLRTFPRVNKGDSLAVIVEV